MGERAAVFPPPVYNSVRGTSSSGFRDPLGNCPREMMPFFVLSSNKKKRQNAAKFRVITPFRRSKV